MRKILRRLIILIACFTMAFGCIANRHAQANIFLKPAQEKQITEQKTKKDTFLSRILDRARGKVAPQATVKNGIIQRPQNNASAAQSSSQKQVARYQPAKQRPFSKEAFAIYKQSRAIDPALLTFAGREPQTPEEIMQVAAYHNTGNVIAMLENRRKRREELYTDRNARARAAVRNDLLRQSAEARQQALEQKRHTQSGGASPARAAAPVPAKTIPQSAPQKSITPKKPLYNAPKKTQDKKPSRVFTDF